MAGVQFYKYSAYGNTFVVLDELESSSLDDLQKSAFAPIATDEFGGVGADNLLVVQRFSAALITEIQQCRDYWPASGPKIEGERPEYVFRMFEPDGSEALCCGNGLLCIAMHMNRVHGITRCSVLTEIPSPAPRVREIATLPNEPEFQHEVRIGKPRNVPVALMLPAAEASREGVVSILRPLTLTADPGSHLPNPVVVEGYVTYTGEPHMVIVDDERHSPALRELYARIMGKPESTIAKTGNVGTESSRPDAPGIDLHLLNELGLLVNRAARDLFPHGINISFARLRQDEQLVEYRCFERGIYKETLACGTAAIAVATVFRQLGQTRGDTLTFWPKRSRGNAFYSNARIQVTHDANGDYWLRGQARRIFEATLRTSEYPDVVRPPST